MVAERLGYSPAEARSLGKALAGRNAYRKGVAIGLSELKKGAERRPRAKPPGKVVKVKLLDSEIPAVRTKEGLRALAGGRPITPESVDEYLRSKSETRCPRCERP